MSDPIKIKRKSADAKKSSAPSDLSSTSPILSTVSYMTIPIASLKIDSPKTMAKRLTSASISLNMAITATGSVALIRLPKANDSFHVNSGERSVCPTMKNRMEEQKMAMKVPMKEYARTVPKF